MNENWSDLKRLKTLPVLFLARSLCLLYMLSLVVLVSSMAEDIRLVVQRRTQAQARTVGQDIAVNMGEISKHNKEILSEHIFKKVISEYICKKEIC